MNKVEKILREKTMQMFSDIWYEKTTNEILNINNTSNGYVYFVKNGKNKLIKIGSSLNLHARLNSFLTTFPNGVFLVGYIYCNNFSELEKKIHIDFKKNRKSGEWFDIESKDIINIKDFNLIESYFNKDSSVIDGECFNLHVNNISFGVKDYYSDFYEYCKTLVLGISYDKAIFYNNIIALNKNYKTISKKRVNLVLKKWCKTMGYNYDNTNERGCQLFTISK